MQALLKRNTLATLMFEISSRWIAQLVAPSPSQTRIQSVDLNPLLT